MQNKNIKQAKLKEPYKHQKDRLLILHKPLTNKISATALEKLKTHYMKHTVQIEMRIQIAKESVEIN